MLKEEKLTSLRMQGLQTGQNGRNVCWSRLQRVKLIDIYTNVCINSILKVFIQMFKIRYGFYHRMEVK
ncbi:hypothetical protein ANACAC_03838 [Anaerostipes caccae L1-92]|uniref:Uncharacterized protein n=1 Tax=Anaerostipes caccae (strain DSM 14662 / CCUG 47493 / JCM 13470 / NCIMB 13811 / L1-92) TaxID=411490 RepID=B0MJM6_ANACD|nr:hypothetical protein ANACAC_03838 [Anaerostipes caccae L1-92]